MNGFKTNFLTFDDGKTNKPFKLPALNVQWINNLSVMFIHVKVKSKTTKAINIES